MSLFLAKEKLHPIPVAYELATGIRPHTSTCHRYRIRGIKGVKLETVKCGGRRLTSVEAVFRFNERITAETNGVNLPPRTNRRRQMQISAAERQLQQDGI